MSIKSKLAELEALELKMLSIEHDFAAVAIDLSVEMKALPMDYWARLLNRLGVDGTPAYIEVDKENLMDIRVILYNAEFGEIAELVTEEIASFGDDND